MHVYLLRHGQTPSNRVCRLTGDHDEVLTALGRRQARGVARFFDREKIAFDAVYTSELRRAQETARIATRDAYPLRTSPFFNERAFGEWQGFTFDEVAEQRPEEWRAYQEDPLEYMVRGARESMLQAVDRVQRALHDVLAGYEIGDTLLFVLHGGTMGGALSELLDTPYERFSNALAQPLNCALSKFVGDEVEEEVGVVRWYEPEYVHRLVGGKNAGQGLFPDQYYKPEHQ